MKKTFYVVLVCFFVILSMGCFLNKLIKRDRFHMFVINLSKSKDRFHNFKKYHNNMIHKVPLTRVEAVDKKDIVNTPLFKKWHQNIALNPQFKSKEESNNYIKRTMGTRAILLSNAKTLKIAKQTNPEWTIICEDDAELPKDINFDAIVKQFPASKVIYLDNRNKGGDGYTPRCCLSCVMYHRSVLDFFVKERNPETSSQLETFNKTVPFINNDFYLYWLITKFNIKCSSLPIVHSGRFDSMN
jgi:hypothetical protein